MLLTYFPVVHRFLNPVPIAPTFMDETDLTIAVSLGGKPQVIETITDIEETTEDNGFGFTEKITAFVDSFRDAVGNEVSHDWGAYDIANQAFDAMQGTIARQKLAAYPPDYFIEIAQNACGTLEYNRASEMITLGYNKAEKSLGRLLSQ